MRNTRTSQSSVAVNHVCQPQSGQPHRNHPKSGSKPTPYQKGDDNWYCTLNGKQYYLGTNPLKAQAKLDRIVAGDDHKPIAGPTLGDIVERYLQSLENNQSPDTIRTKGFAYKSFVEFAGRDTVISSITADTIEKFKQEQLRINSRVTARTKIIMVSALLQYAIDLGYISENPARGVAPIKQTVDPDPDHLNEEEVETLLALTEKQRYKWLRYRDKMVFMLMLHAGLRRIEVCNVKWSDVNLDRNLIVLRTTKGLKPRMIGISQALGDLLKEYRAQWKKNDVYVMTNRSGGQISREGLSHLARKYVERLGHHYRGKRRFSLHSLRATFATTLAGRGVGTRVIQGLLGHSDPRTTLRYAAYTEKMAVDAVKVLDV